MLKKFTVVSMVYYRLDGSSEGFLETNKRNLKFRRIKLLPSLYRSGAISIHRCGRHADIGGDGIQVVVEFATSLLQPDV